MAPNCSRKPTFEEMKGSQQNRICSQGDKLDKLMCCGIKIDFYEDIGHTLTLADHHRSCAHYRQNYDYTNTQDSRMLTGQLPHLPPLSMPPKPGSQLPYPQPRCRDVHRSISLVPGKCGCQYPARYISIPHDILLPERSERTALHQSEILRRRVYWLQQESIDTEALASARLLSWSTKLRKHQQQELELDISFADRTFVYDPDCGANAFLAAIEVGFLKKEQRCCVICNRKASNQHSRSLPCGYVLDIRCLKRWFLGRKDCPLCRKGFNLVKKRTPYEAGYREHVWDDSNYSGLV